MTFISKGFVPSDRCPLLSAFVPFAIWLDEGMECIFSCRREAESVTLVLQARVACGCK